MPRWPITEDPPAGLRYQAELVTVDEEQGLLEALAHLEYRPVEMRGQTAKRTVRHYGLRYDYERGELAPTDPLPEALEWLRERAAGLGDLPPDALVQILLTRYPAGATIGWHRDAPMFGSVVGVSLAATCRLRFRRERRGQRELWETEAAPRSGYVLRGAARWSWQHSIPAVREQRFSVTFRTLREPPTAAG